MAHYSDVITDLTEPTASLRDASPDVWAGFAQLHKAAVADGALPAKTRHADVQSFLDHREPPES